MVENLNGHLSSLFTNLSLEEGDVLFEWEKIKKDSIYK